MLLADDALLRRAGLRVADRLGPHPREGTEAERAGSSAPVRADGSLSRADVRAIQSKVGARPDGVIGRETTAKLQQAIGMSPNGAKSFRTDRATVRALQTHLNGA